MADFITISKNVTTGELGGLPRAILIVTRETVTGFTPDPETGIYRINATDEDAFIAANTTQYGLVSAITNLFAQTYTPDYVYILSAPSGVSSALLNAANKEPRAWSFITLVSQLQGSDSDETPYFTDLGVIGTWLASNDDKVCVHTYSVEEDGGTITLPATLQLNGAINNNQQIKTIVSNAYHQADEYAPIIFDNIAIAWMSFNLYGTVVSRSWGSLSDSHDYAYVSGDTYGSTARSVITNANLGQYNGAKDRAGSLFVYDTLMNDSSVPPDSKQIETVSAINYIIDYVYVYVHNTLQAAGETGVTNDDAGINRILGLTIAALNDCFNLNLILSNEAGQPDYTISAKTAAQVTVLSPTWQTTGVWPEGVIVAVIRPFGATHYITLNFNFA